MIAKEVKQKSTIMVDQKRKKWPAFFLKYTVKEEDSFWIETSADIIKSIGWLTFVT